MLDNFGFVKLDENEKLVSSAVGHPNNDLSLLLLIIIGGILFLAIAGALGMHIMGEKGRSMKVGFLVGACLPLIGHLLLALVPSSNLHLVEELHARNLMSNEDYNKTREVVLKDLDK